jgi:acyl-CoA thioesterase YciA
MQPEIDYDKIAQALGAIRIPEYKLAIQVLAMPADTNPHGDIFGGWLLSQMDIAGAIIAQEVAKNRVVTVGLDAMTFVKPVFVGDILKCYAVTDHIGNTSITVYIEAYATRASGETELVTKGKFTYVSIDPNRNPRPIKP